MALYLVSLRLRHIILTIILCLDLYLFRFFLSVCFSGLNISPSISGLSFLLVSVLLCLCLSLLTPLFLWGLIYIPQGHQVY